MAASATVAIVARDPWDRADEEPGSATRFQVSNQSGLAAIREVIERIRVFWNSRRTSSARRTSPSTLLVRSGDAARATTSVATDSGPTRRPRERGVKPSGVGDRTPPNPALMPLIKGIRRGMQAHVLDDLAGGFGLRKVVAPAPPVRTELDRPRLDVPRSATMSSTSGPAATPRCTTSSSSAGRVDTDCCAVSPCGPECPGGDPGHGPLPLPHPATEGGPIPGLLRAACSPRTRPKAVARPRSVEPAASSPGRRRPSGSKHPQ